MFWHALSAIYLIGTWYFDIQTSMYLYCAILDVSSFKLLLNWISFSICSKGPSVQLRYKMKNRCNSGSIYAWFCFWKLFLQLPFTCVNLVVLDDKWIALIFTRYSSSISFEVMGESSHVDIIVDFMIWLSVVFGRERHIQYPHELFTTKIILWPTIPNIEGTWLGCLLIDTNANTNELKKCAIDSSFFKIMQKERGTWITPKKITS